MLKKPAPCAMVREMIYMVAVANAVPTKKRLFVQVEVVAVTVSVTVVADLAVTAVARANEKTGSQVVHTNGNIPQLTKRAENQLIFSHSLSIGLANVVFFGDFL